jgi:NAD+ diphosphatase
LPPETGDPGAASADRRSRANAFAGHILDRESERRDDAAWLDARLASADARILVLHPDASALVDAGAAALRLLTPDERARWLQAAPASYLGSEAGVAYFVLQAGAAAAASLATSLDARFLDLRSAGRDLETFHAGLFAYARALAHWQSRMRHCPACAAPLRQAGGGHRAVCSDAACAIEQFPRVDPAVIMIVGHGDACLLGRQAGWGAHRYSTLAGFVEPGETLEDAVCREVMEEAGVRVVRCDYHSSQPWPFPSSLMVGFVAEAATRELRVGPELEDARWFTVAELVRGLGDGSLKVSAPLSVSYRLIEHWLRRTAGLELAALAGAPH